MSRHILGVDIIATANEEIFHLFDTSAYAQGLGVTCPRLEISIPGYKKIRVLEPAPYFNLALNGITLDLISAQTDTLPALPDGIYHLKYSVSPNEYVVTELDYLRTTSFDGRLNDARCSIGLGPCAPDQDAQSNLDQLQEITHYMNAAKAAVMNCFDNDKGMALYTYAVKLLALYSSTC